MEEATLFHLNRTQLYEIEFQTFDFGSLSPRLLEVFKVIVISTLRKTLFFSFNCEAVTFAVGHMCDDVGK